VDSGIAPSSGQNFQSVLLHDAQKLERRVQVTGEYRLADMTVFAQLLDLFGRNWLRDC
jgi:hypothetical protein